VGPLPHRLTLVESGRTLSHHLVALFSQVRGHVRRAGVQDNQHLQPAEVRECSWTGECPPEPKPSYSLLIVVTTLTPCTTDPLRKAVTLGLRVTTKWKCGSCLLVCFPDDVTFYVPSHDAPTNRLQELIDLNSLPHIFDESPFLSQHTTVLHLRLASFVVVVVAGFRQ
jgi:hypothetical protein